MRTRLLIVSTGIVAALLAAAPAARAGESFCNYSPLSGGSVEARIVPPDQSVKMYVAGGGQIRAKFDPARGDVDCGDATTANTQSIQITGTDGDDLVVIAQNGPGGPFPPASKGFLVNAGEGNDELRLIGTTDPDSFRFGMLTELANPLADLNGGGSWNIATNDVEEASARMLAGNDRVTGNPQGPNELPSPFPLDLKGNRGADSLIGAFVIDLLAGGSGDDDEKGLGGADILLGQAGDDDLNGGPGNDDCSGGPGDDRLRGCES